MINAASALKSSPALPRVLSLPCRLLPPVAHSTVLVALLNRLFSPELAGGELDFLDQKSLLIHITDAGIRYQITLKHGRLCQDSAKEHIDLSIEGHLYDFMLLAARREDPDTLFFNRRLRLGGNTELGLYLKNFLDSLELEERLGPMLALLQKTTAFVDQVTKHP